MLNVMYAGNASVFKGILLSVMSLAKFNPVPIHVLVLTMDLSAENPKYQPINDAQIALLNQILQQHHPDSQCTRYDLTTIYHQNINNRLREVVAQRFTPYSLLRLCVDMLPDLPDKILYLDADTLVLGSLTDLFELDLTGYEFAAAKDYFGKIFIKHNYCNSGVLLLNLPQIRATNLLTKVRHLLAHKKLLLADQSALNRCATKKLILDPKYNHQRRLYPHTIIRHYCASWRFFPYIHLKTVKQWQTDIVLSDQHNVYNNQTVTQILNEYLQLQPQISHLL